MTFHQPFEISKKRHQKLLIIQNEHFQHAKKNQLWFGFSACWNIFGFSVSARFRFFSRPKPFRFFGFGSVFVRPDENFQFRFGSRSSRLKIFAESVPLALLLNSSKYFPSRVSMKQTSVAKLGSISRRVYRIFSHAFYHHKHIFLDFENQTQLCRRFSKFVLAYNLMPADTLIVPVDSLEAGLVTQAPTSGEKSDFEGYATATIARAVEPPKAPETPEQAESPSDSVILDSGSSGVLPTPAPIPNAEESVEDSLNELNLDDTETNSGEQTIIESEDISTA
jgi:hypothetical protein